LRRYRAIQLRVLTTVLVFRRAVPSARDRVPEHESGVGREAAHVAAAVARHTRTDAEILDGVGDRRTIDGPKLIQLLLGKAGDHGSYRLTAPDGDGPRVETEHALHGVRQLLRQHRRPT